MDIDQRIKQELETEADEIDAILSEEKGLFSLAMGIFKGGMRRWVIMVNVVVLLASIGLFWSGYLFFIASDLNGQVFWGIIFIVAAQVQISLKMWLFSEMARTSTFREIKRTELAIVKMERRLDEKLDQLLESKA